MATPNEIASRMIRSLSVSEPELDTGVGTPIRKIIDTVAEAIAETTVDSYLTSYQYDIDTRTGADLDAFAALFGFYRLRAKKSNGYILLQRTTVAPTSIRIPAGSQASTGGTDPIIVQTLTPAQFARGTVVLEVPVEAVEGGSKGDIAAGSITRWLTEVEGITSVTNPAPLTGGADAETDEQFRDRIKRTIFRNLAGTKDQYLAVALGQRDTVSAEVYGAYERWIERIEIVGGTGSPSIATPPGTRQFTVDHVGGVSGRLDTGPPHELNNGDYVRIVGMTGVGNTIFNGLKRVRYVLDHNSFFLENLDGTPITGTANAGSGTLYPVSRMSGSTSMSHAFGENIDFNQVFPKTLYTVDFTSAPPIVTIVDTETIPDGVYELAFTYTSQGSRNQPYRTSNIIADRVDVWIDGETVERARVVAVLDSNNVIEATDGVYSCGAYRRRDGSRPDLAGGSIILPLPLLPIVSIPSSISIGSAIYYEGDDYWIVDRVEHETMGSMESLSGIEFATGKISAAANAVPHTLSIASGTNASPIVLTLTGTNNFKVGQRVKVEGYSRASINGEWYISAVGASTITLAGTPAPGGTGSGGTVRLFHPVSLNYNFNVAPLQVQRDIEEWRMAGSDLLVHKARPLPLKVFVAVILDSGYSVTSVQAPIEAAVNTVLRASGIGGVLQISDLLNAMSTVSGVDAVRMLSGGDRAAKAINGVVASGSDAQITTTTPHGFVQGDLVDISSVLGATGINGVWRVKTVSSDTVFIVEHGYLGGVYSSGGSVRSANYAIQVMSPDGTRPMTLIADRTQTPPRAIDLHANDTEHFVLHSVDISVKAQNSWGVN